MMMIIIVFYLAFLTSNIQMNIIPLVFNSTDFNETDHTQPLVIYNNNNETTINGNQSSMDLVDKNQFAETVVDLLLDLLEKANLSRNVSVIHNDTELTELVEQDDGNSTPTTTKLID